MGHTDPPRISDGLWERVREKKIAAALGRPPDPPPDLQLIRVNCEVAPAALRPLLEARRLTEAILGEARARPERSKLRARTLFGDTPERATEVVVVELWNQLAQQKGARWVVVFDAVEHADKATLAALTQIVQRAEWMRLPLLLVFHSEPKEAAADLLASVRGRDAGAVMRGEQPRVGEPQRFDWNALPAKTLRVLRAGALIGPGFELRILADLLALEPLEVLEQLQHAVDLGVPIEDRGEGRFSLPASALSTLSASIMPSLAQAWHRQLGRLLGGRAVKVAATPPPPPNAARIATIRRERLGDARVAEIIDLSHEVSDLVAETTDEASSAAHVAANRPEVGPPNHDPSGLPDPKDIQPSPTNTAAPPESAPHASPKALVQRRTVVAAPSRGTGAPVRPRTLLLAPDVDLPAPAQWSPSPKTGATELEDPLVDKVRAAEHMRLAGDAEAAAEHLCEAARTAAEMGAPQVAAQHVNEVLELLATLPTGASRQRLRARALLERGRLQWQAAGYEHGFTLAQALVSLEAARAELGPDAPVDLAVDLAQALAGVYFELGDPHSLARALAELEEASRKLQTADDTIGAACLFNDQAAVRVRMGDAASALQLLRASRAIFDARGQDDQVALRELAETEHLFAKLPLHARMRLGREEEGYAIGLQHALAAERAYGELDDPRELARLWETMGRLELKRCRIEEARQRLEAAFETQTRIGDLTGLAQTTELLSEVLAWCGRNDEAVTMLRDSVVYNRDKGSPRGLISNRQAFTALSSRFAALPKHAEGLREVEVLLAAGERELGVSPQAATQGVA